MAVGACIAVVDGVSVHEDGGAEAEGEPQKPSVLELAIGQERQSRRREQIPFVHA
ncbi:hypothetical protein D3C81_1127470 [compost metagenome]